MLRTEYINIFRTTSHIQKANNTPFFEVITKAELINESSYFDLHIPI